MTRRVRFAPWTLAAWAAVAAPFLRPTDARAAEVPLVPQGPIATSVFTPLDVRPADIDRDGDLDVLIPALSETNVLWHENTAGNGSAWTVRTIAPGVGNAFSLDAADVDGDGDPDVIGALNSDNVVTWHENTSGNGATWATHTIATKTIAFSVAGTDVDGDGDTDVLVALAGPDPLAWYENVGGDGSTWIYHAVSTAFASARRAVASDVDSDGDTDVVATVGVSDALLWYENTLGNGSAWTVRTIDDVGGLGTYALDAGDVDGDGDVDAVRPGTNKTVSWYENTAGNGSAWSRHTIATGFETGGGSAADLDGDGDLDVFSTLNTAGVVAWHENAAGDGSVWTTRTITTDAPGALAISAGDLDHDGDADVIWSAETNNIVAWHRNETIHANACFVASPSVTTAAIRPYSVVPSDVDGDGDLDVVSGEELRVAWYANDVGAGAPWTARTVGTADDVFRSVAVSDIDGDGDPDVVAGARFGGRVFWYENALGDGTTWVQRTVATSLIDLWFVFTGDVDGDGDVDVLSASRYDDKVAWHENVAGTGTTWTPRIISTASVRPYSVTASDVDRDGDLDVLSTALDGKVAWHENLAGTGTTWLLHTITTANSPHSHAVGDLDGDGDPDVLLTAGFGFSRAWSENTTGSGSAWASHTISSVMDNPRSIGSADIDGDGDLDAFSSALSGNVDWFENTAGNGLAWTASNVGSSPGTLSFSVAAADFDGDGQGDLVNALLFPGRIEWHHNRGGQISLGVTDTAPPTAGNSELVAMLRAVASHLGRNGDHDAELASIGLLFEKAPGEPMSSSEANALLESLRVYRDANGNGIFDPLDDVLVTNVSTLTLAAGVQAITFSDADPNLQVAFGSPRTYFVVIETTSDASQQSPNQFRVTHLGVGPSAARAEDRDFDIPLRTACPTDVSSSFRQIVPVELTGFSIE